MQRPREVKPFLPWLVWGVAVLAYAVAVFNRGSLAALGPTAQQHFGIDATTLSMFALIQLAVYAGAQIPVGTLLDRFGASRLIVSGSVLMVGGQIVMATVADVRFAILARILVGAGDACVFISVMRLLPEWFPVRRLPTMSQLVGLIGQAGQLVSVAPLAFVVGTFGWVNGFIGVCAVTLLAGILTFIVVRDAPGARTFLESLFAGRRNGHGSQGSDAGQRSGEPATPADPAPAFRAQLVQLLRMPGVRLAYWVHFTSQFAPNAFILLWGTPFLTGGIGLSTPQASAMLSLVVVSSMTSGLMAGPFISRFSDRRIEIFVGVVLLIALLWVAVMLWPGIPPTWLVIALMIAIPLGYPASMIAFEVSREYTPLRAAGLGTGIANTGGSTAALIVILGIGVILDAQGAGSPETYSLDAFRWAFAVQIPVWALGIGMALLERRRARDTAS
ncbi:MFS transporter [Leucobacter sp. GX24907]